MIDSELEQTLSEMTFEEQQLLKEVILESQVSVGNEGAFVRRQVLDTMDLKAKKEKKICMLLAKNAKDPLHAKYVKFFKLSRVWRAKIWQKYMGRAKSILASAGGSNGIKSVSYAEGVKKTLGLDKVKAAPKDNGAVKIKPKV